jgi:adenylate kinase family enzyme
MKRKLDHVLVLEVDDKANWSTASKSRAAETGGARTDDNEETLKKRLKVIPRPDSARFARITRQKACCAK